MKKPKHYTVFVDLHWKKYIGIMLLAISAITFSKLPLRHYILKKRITNHKTKNIWIFTIQQLWNTASK